MASIGETIKWLEELPNDIAETGKNFVRESIVSHGNFDNGDMYNQVQGSAYGNVVRIRVWSHYAAFVNDGHGPSYPIRWKGVHIKPSMKWYGGWVHHTSGYAGSHFFDDAADQLRAYISTL